MKRYGNLFDKICSEENIDRAMTKASKGKKKRHGIKNTLERREESVKRIAEMLRSGTYKTSHYHEKVLYEPKKRVIYSLPFFPDRVVHHAIMNVLEPLWDSFLDSACHSCRKTMGCHSGSNLCKKYVETYRYALQCDISKFYPSIDHAICKKIVRKKIKDPRLLALIDEIIDSANTIRGATIGKNAPIGNLLSQWLGNLYLNEMDLLLRHHYKVHAYVRYCDDFVIFSDDKQYLNRIREELPKFLEKHLALRLSKIKLYPVTRGVNFLGYRHFPECILVRKRTVVKIKRFAKRILSGKIKLSAHNRGSASSFYGILAHANTFNLRQAINFDEVLKKFNIKIKSKKKGGGSKVQEFKDFAEVNFALEGDKLSISDVVNKKIAIYDFKIGPSKKNPGTDYAQIQLKQIKDDGTEEEEFRVLFTGAAVIIKQLQKYKEKLPFVTTIKQKGRSNTPYYILT